MYMVRDMSGRSLLDRRQSLRSIFLRDGYSSALKYLCVCVSSVSWVLSCVSGDTSHVDTRSAGLMSASGVFSVGFRKHFPFQPPWRQVRSCFGNTLWRCTCNPGCSTRFEDTRSSARLEVDYSSVLEYLCVSAPCVPWVSSCVSGDTSHLCGDRSFRGSATQRRLDIRHGLDRVVIAIRELTGREIIVVVTPASWISHVLAMGIPIKSLTSATTIACWTENMRFTSSCT